MQDDTFPQGSLSQCGLSFLRTVPTRPENTSGKKWRWEMCSEIFWISGVPSNTFLQKLTQALKRVSSKDILSSSRMWWLLLWGGYIWEKSTIKNRAQAKPFLRKKKMQVQKNPAWFPNTFSYKHLQKTTRTHPHCICMGAPRLMALQNATTERPRFFLDVSLPYNGFQTLDTLEQKPMGFKPEIDQRVRKKTQVYRHINSQTFYFMPFSWEKYQHPDLDETKVKCCIFFGTFWVICSFQNSKNNQVFCKFLSSTPQGADYTPTFISPSQYSRYPGFKVWLERYKKYTLEMDTKHILRHVGLVMNPMAESVNKKTTKQIQIWWQNLSGCLLFVEVGNGHHW